METDKSFYNLTPFAILRDPANGGFSLVSPKGKIMSSTRDEIESLISLHGTQEPGEPPSGLVRAAMDNGLIAIDGKISSPPFQPGKIIENLKETRFQILTLTDIVVSTGKQCNYNCNGCSTESGPRAADEKIIPEIRAAILESSQFGAINLGFTGGEPLLPHNIANMDYLCREAKKSGFENISCATNGTYVPHYSGEIKKMGISHLILPLHGDSDTAKRYTGHPSPMKNTINAMAVCREEGINVTVNYVVTRENILQLSDTVDYVLGLDNDSSSLSVFVSPLIPVGRASSLRDNLLDYESYLALLEQFGNLRQKHGNRVKFACKNNSVKAADPIICNAGLIFVSVDSSGTVSGCDDLAKLDPKGSIHVEPFWAIWNDNTRWDKYRKPLTVNKSCRSCSESARSYCFGKCKTLSLARYNSADMEAKPVTCAIK